MPSTRGEVVTAATGGSRELRLAVVCYGGVSLAIYMHGQTKELNRLVKASALLDEGHDPDGASQSERVYAALLEATARDGARTRVIVDIVAGTSAGGINGVCLAKAVAGNRSQDGLRTLWLEKGDIGGLIRGPRWLPWKLRLAGVLPLLARRPPLHDEMASWVHGALAQMDASGPEPPGLGTLMPDGHSLELFVTVTDYYGYPREVVLAGSDPDDEEDPVPIYDWRHRHALEFRRDGTRDQFAPEHNAALALAARATSSFPGAFPPVSFAAFAKAVRSGGAREVDLSRPDVERGYFRIYGLSGSTAAGTFFVDGGVLDNRPFGHAITAIRRKPAATEVDRRLIYLEPDPANGPAAGSRSGRAEPRTIPTVLGAVSGIPRKEPLLDDLLDVARRNETVRRVRDVIEASFDPLAAAVENLVGDALHELPASAADERLGEWSAAINDAARADAGFAYSTYIRIKIGDVVDDYAASVCRVNEYPDECNQAFFVRSALRAWARRKGLFEREGAPTLEQIDFLRKLDLRYAERRVRFVIAGVNWFYRDVGVEGFPAREALDALKRRLYEAVGLLRSVGRGQGADETLAGRVTELFGEEALRRFARGEGFRPIAFAAAEEAELDALRDGFDTFVRGRLETFTPELYADVCRLTSGWRPKRRADLFVRYLGFPFWDVLLYPVQSLTEVGERDHVEVSRMSPRDSSLLSRTVERKLAGIGVHHFGAFFTRAGRETDYLWGRLDAAERLIELLIGRDHTAFEAWCRRAFEAIVEEERDALPQAGDLIERLADPIGRLPADGPVLGEAARL